MYKDTDIELKGKTWLDNVLITCSPKCFSLLSFFLCFVITCLHVLVVSFGCPEEMDFTIHWLLKYYPCHNEYNNIEVSNFFFNHWFIEAKQNRTA